MSVFVVMVWSSSMAHQLIECAWLVMDGKFVDNGFGCLVEADDLDLCALTAEFEYGHVQGCNRRDIPDMSTAHVYGHLLRGFLEVKRLHEVLGRGKEKLPFDGVGAVIAVRRNLGT